MAAEPKKKALYGKSPRIEREPEKGDTDKSGHMAEASKTAEVTAEKPNPEGDMEHGGDTKGDVMAGTDGIPTSHHEHSRERSEMHHRHMAEHHEMHHRHEREHLMRVMGHHSEGHEDMHERHHKEKRALHTKHEREMRDMHDRHEDTAEGPSGGIKEKKVDKVGATETAA